MRTNNMMRWAIASGVALLSVASVAADIAVSKWGRGAVDGDTPAIGAGEGLFLNGGEASFAFASDGTLTLPWDNLFMFGNAEIGVRSGTLRVTASAKPDLVANPPAELQKAALWLDATRNVQTQVFGSAICALAWFDARESSAAASSYDYAAAGDVSGEGPRLATFNYRTCINFRAYIGSGNDTRRSFLYKDASGADKSYDVRHAFFVQTVKALENTAPVLGSKTKPNFYTDPSHPDYWTMLARNGAANPVAYASDYLVDGVYGDATATISLGTHLHEFTLPPNKTLATDSLMRDRGYASGGHCINEILLFTNRLTVLERRRISAYLQAKWSCGMGGMIFDSVSNAVVEIADNLSLDSLAVKGAGVLAVSSGACASAAHLYADVAKERVPYALKDGTASLELQAMEYDYRLAPRERLTVTATKQLSTLTKDDAAPVGSASVTSERPFIVSELDPAIKSLSFSGGGDLVLRAPSVRDSAYMPGTASVATFAATSLSVPAGNASGAETSVNVPAAGDWEIEFKMYNSLPVSVNGGHSDGQTASYRVQLKSGDAVVWERIPTVVGPDAYANAEQFRRYLVRNLAAGTYTFHVEGRASNALAASLSDLAMAYMPNPTRETVVPMTDGDFESSWFVRACFASRDNNLDGRTQWTLTNGNLTQNPAFQAIVSSAMGATNYSYMFRSPQLGRYGDNALLWYHGSSIITAKSPATSLPAGTYKLRVDAVRWMTGTENHSNTGGRCNNAATLEAFVKLNGGAGVSIGQVGSIENFTVERYVFPQAFTVAEGDSVEIALGQSTANAAVQLDNFEFVKVEEDGAATTLGEELVVDGGAASANVTAWTLDDWTNTYRHVVQARTPVDNFFGATKCEGDYVFRSANGGRAYQTIAFPAGVFRLSWWSRARVEGSSVTYRTPITFWYAADGAATTNEIVKSEMSWCTNFLEHVAYFSVPTAGNYVFGFNSQDKNGTDVLVDCVSVRQVLGPDTTPDIQEDTEINVTGGKLRLDYKGCLKLSKIKVDGQSLVGEVSAALYPNLVCGPGTALVTPKGTLMIFR